MAVSKKAKKTRSQPPSSSSITSTTATPYSVASASPQHSTAFLHSSATDFAPMPNLQFSTSGGSTRKMGGSVSSKGARPGRGESKRKPKKLFKDIDLSMSFQGSGSVSVSSDASPLPGIFIPASSLSDIKLDHLDRKVAEFSASDKEFLSKQRNGSGDSKVSKPTRMRRNQCDSDKLHAADKGSPTSRERADIEKDDEGLFDSIHLSGSKEHGVLEASLEASQACNDGEILGKHVEKDDDDDRVSTDDSALLSTVKEATELYDMWDDALQAGQQPTKSHGENISRLSGNIVIEDDIGRSYGDRDGGLEKIRKWKSTGNVKEHHNKNHHKHLKLEVSSVLPPLVDVNEDNMEWRKSKLEEQKETTKLKEAIFVLETTDDFKHPLHCIRKSQEQLDDDRKSQEQLDDDDDSDVSVITNESVMSTLTSMSLFSYQQWFGTNQSRSARSLSSSRHGASSSSFRNGCSSKSLLTQRSGRRFIDLTVNEGRNEDAGDGYDSDVCAGTSVDGSDDGSVSISSIFSIPGQKDILVQADAPSISRNFIDLTEGQDELPQTSQIFPMFSWRGKSEIKLGEDEISVKLCLESDSEDEDETDYDEITQYTAEAWEVADKAFIENVHEIARNLEKQLNDQGFESPFWGVDQIIPPFKQIHSKIQENMDSRKRESQEAKSPPELVDEIEEDSSSRHSRKSYLSNSSVACRRTMLPSQDLESGYDDLNMRRLDRDHRAYLKNFMYDYRYDETCSLPLVLAGGLEKRLPAKVIQEAVEILSNLVSPLRRCRAPVMESIEEDNESFGAHDLTLSEGNDDEPDISSGKDKLTPGWTEGREGSIKVGDDDED